MSLDVADLDISRAGLVVTLRKSKTDQEGRSRRIGIPYGSSEASCPVRSLQAWLESARIIDGPVFRALDRFQRVQPGRLSDVSVARVVKRRAKAVGWTRRATADIHSAPAWPRVPQRPVPANASSWPKPATALLTWSAATFGMAISGEKMPPCWWACRHRLLLRASARDRGYLRRMGRS